MPQLEHPCERRGKRRVQPVKHTGTFPLIQSGHLLLASLQLTSVESVLFKENEHKEPNNQLLARRERVPREHITFWKSWSIYIFIFLYFFTINISNECAIHYRILTPPPPTPAPNIPYIHYIHCVRDIPDALLSFLIK